MSEEIFFLYEEGKIMTELFVIEAEYISHILWYSFRYRSLWKNPKQLYYNSIISSENKIPDFLWVLWCALIQKVIVYLL